MKHQSNFWIKLIPKSLFVLTLVLLVTLFIKELTIVDKVVISLLFFLITLQINGLLKLYSLEIGNKF